MALPSRLMGSGVGAQAAVNICGDAVTGLTAAGSSNTNALQLSAAINNVTTTAASTGVKLPPTEVGGSIVVANLGANALLVYPAELSQINALTVTTGGFSVAAGKVAVFTGVSGTNLIGMLGA
jgi:hypothetical protein